MKTKRYGFSIRFNAPVNAVAKFERGLRLLLDSVGAEETHVITENVGHHFVGEVIHGRKA